MCRFRTAVRWSNSSSPASKRLRTQRDRWWASKKKFPSFPLVPFSRKLREMKEMRELMPYEFKFPVLSEENEEGIVVAWFKREGSEIHAGEKLLEVQLAKVSYDVPAPISGKLQKILAPRDAVIKQGQVLAILLQPGESETGAAPTQPTAPAQAAAPEAAAFVPASPAARRLAREHNIDLARVPGSGPEGRVSEEDVRKYLAAQAAPVTPPPPPPHTPRPNPPPKRRAKSAPRRSPNASRKNTALTSPPSAPAPPMGASPNKTYALRLKRARQ